jgi:hypothetical protein
MAMDVELYEVPCGGPVPQTRTPIRHSARSLTTLPPTATLNAAVAK